MRFVVFKGIQGFGDRLQCLLQVISYARATNRCLVLDWRDSDWTHDPEIGSDYYFSLNGVLACDLNQFLAYYSANKQRLKVFPSAWADKLLDPNYVDWIYKKIFWTDSENGLIDLVATLQEPDFEDEIVVYCGVGKRSFTYSDAEAVCLARWLNEEIRQFFIREEIHSGHYGVIHLRGGSKSWSGGHVPLADLRMALDQKWPNQRSYLESVYESYQAGLGSLQNGQVLRLLILSDSERLTEAWLNTYGVGDPLKTFNTRFRESGLHKLTKEDLLAISPKITKVELNFQLIRDFVLMLNARYIANDGHSLFSQMAKGCAQAGVRWLSPSTSVR